MRVLWISPDDHNPPPSKIVTIAVDNDDDYFIDLFTLNDCNERLDSNTSAGVLYPNTINVLLGGCEAGVRGGLAAGWLIPVTIIVQKTDYTGVIAPDPPVITEESRDLDKDNLTFALAPPNADIEYAVVGMRLRF